MSHPSTGPPALHPTAPISRAIKLITATVIVINVGLFGVCFVSGWAGLPAVVLTIITLGCYLRAPVSYSIAPAGLAVFFRLGSKSFGPVMKASAVVSDVGRSVRLWGNGGLFAATGIFSNRAWGTFRAYVTTSDRTHFALVETASGKVLVSPDNVDAFIKAATDQET
jgi:hypothetical protein